jgi:23S rRNA (cytosine1962-C5)-methyltransferase
VLEPTPGAARTLDHDLIDIGDGRRLDRFGPVVLDRPCPHADRTPRRDPGAWRRAMARFERSTEGGVVHAEWITADGEPIEPWVIHEGDLRFECRLASSGQVGVFPEQAAQRGWLTQTVAAIIERSGQGPAEGATAVLSLFAYTGGSTLAAALGGASVTHLDASRPAIGWARRNAEVSGLGAHPIRWIADDAVAFARREARRGRRYTGIVLDPPTYGHGEHGRDWQIERDLPGLLATCATMIPATGPAFVLVTSHTPDLDRSTIGGWILTALGERADEGSIREEAMELPATSGARLPLGWSVRWQR